MVSTVWIGRAPDDADPDYASAASGSLSGTAFNQVNQALWGYQFRYRAGRDGVTAPTARAALHNIATNVPNAALMGYSASASLSTSMNAVTGANGGAWITSAVASVPGGPTNAAIPIASGTKPLLDVLVTGADGNLGMIASSHLSTPYDTALYRRTGVSQPPPSPFGTLGSQSPEGQLSVGLLCYVNEKPLSPLNRTPGTTDENNPSVINTQTPVFAADHRDMNGAYGGANGGADAGDYLKKFRITVQVKSGANWVTTPAWYLEDDADGAERAANRFTATCAVNLTRGSQYRWTCQTSDHFDTWGTVSGWLYFTVANLGFVTLAGNPVSTIQTNNPGFDFSWAHQSALSTSTVQLKLYNGDTLVYTSAEITKTVANGANGTISWAESGLATPFASGLTWGTTWKYAIRGKDTASPTPNYSDYSDRRQFKTNAAPGIPDSLSPTASQIVTSRPIIYASVLDTDDQAASGLAVTFEIFNNAGTLLQTRAGTLLSYDATTQISRFSYQTVSGDLAAVAIYRFKAYAYDGTLYSGTKTSSATATRSAEAVFDWRAGPTVAVTTPTVAQVFANSTPTFVWTCATQNRYRIRVYLPGTTTVVYERGWVTSTSVKQWTIEAGFLRNNTSYEAEIGCEDTAPLQGFSARVAFSTSYTAPATPGGVSAVPYRIGSDPWPTAILVQADAALSSALFVGRFIYRADLPNKALEVLSSASDLAFIDPHPVSGVTQTYTWRDVYYVDASHTEQIESAGVTVATSIDLKGTVLSSTVDPVGVRTYLTSVQERSRQLNQDKAMVTTWGSAKPRTYFGVGEFWTVPHTVRLLDDGSASAIERERELEAVILSRQTLCYRDERGRKYFVQIDAPEFTDARLLRGDVALTFTEERYVEGYVVLDPEELV
ncbi:MAG: hypothetical protein ACRDHN_04775 [Thermomicrobiales bacterium]